MSNNNDVPFDLDSAAALLDRDLETIEDLPGFEVPSNGEYLLKLTTSIKPVNGSVTVETSYEVVECVKKDNETDPDATVGTKFSNIYTIDAQKHANDPTKKAESEKLGFGKLKELVAGVAESTGEGNLLVLVRDTLASALVRANVSRRQDKEDKERFYPIVKNLMLA